MGGRDLRQKATLGACLEMLIDVTLAFAALWHRWNRCDSATEWSSDKLHHSTMRSLCNINILAKGLSFLQAALLKVAIWELGDPGEEDLSKICHIKTLCANQLCGDSHPLAKVYKVW